MDEIQQQTFGVIIPQGFRIERHSKADKEKISKYIMEECIHPCETALTGFYAEYAEYADMWRVRKQRERKTGRNLFSSRTGETHRGIETLCTFWYRVLTANDPYFEAVAAGTDALGRELTSNDLYAVEQILLKQKTVINFKDKLLNALRSLAAFGAVVIEQPWTQRPVTGRKYMEATDYVLSPLIKTYFDANVPDINMSHFMANVDYLSDYRIYDLSQNDTETWDTDAIKENITNKSRDSNTSKLQAKTRIQERMQRAGYQDLGQKNYNELINFHGRLSRECVETGLIQDLWENDGDDQDPNHVDYSIRILNGDPMVSAYVTQYGDWHTRFITATFKKFELEPIGYGVPRIGKKAQLEMDFMTSNANDLSTMSLFNMWLVNSLSGIKQNQLGIKPLNIIEAEGDLNNVLKPLSPDVNAIAYAINLISQLKTDFRSTTGASDTLQAIITKASATESSLAQTEAVRQQSVFAEIIGEPLLREHMETSHLNNLNHLDMPIWAALSGSVKPMYAFFTKDNLPRNVGIKLKITSDKDYRPERINRLIQAFQLISSIRQMIPTSMNAIRPMITEIFRELGIDPRLLDAPIPIQDQMEMMVARNKGGTGGSPANIGNEIAGEVASEQSGGINEQQTPVGQTPTSSNMGVL